MMNYRVYPATLVAGLLFFSAWMICAQSALAGDVKVEVYLLWGTDDAKSPDSSHKPVDADLKEKLKKLPLKWANYFEVNRKTVALSDGGTKKVTLSDKCDVEIKYAGKSSMEVSLFGKGEPVVKRTQTLSKGETLFLGGNAPNSTAWLVAIKRVE
jgi:hypothetical protein